MADIQPGFTDAATEAQTVFRRCLSALSRPGRVHELETTLRPPLPLTPELAAVALALVDQDVPLWLDEGLAKEPAVAAFLRFHTSAPLVRDPGRATFALVRRPETLPDLALFAQGSQTYPDRSTTIVLALDSLSAGRDFTVTGPGVQVSEGFSAAPLPSDFAARCAANHRLFPRGVDWLLVGEGRILGLPRSASVQAAMREAA